MNDTIAILELTLLAANKVGISRLLILQKIDTKLKLLQLMIRLLHQTKALADTKYMNLAERVIVISKMCGGWLAATKRKQPE